MRGDVWVSINKNGEKILNIDNGKFVSKKVIDKPEVRFKIVQPSDGPEPTSMDSPLVPKNN